MKDLTYGLIGFIKRGILLALIILFTGAYVYAQPAGQGSPAKPYAKTDTKASSGSVRLPTAATPDAAADKFSKTDTAPTVSKKVEGEDTRAGPADDALAQSSKEGKAEMILKDEATGEELVYMNVQDQDIRDIIKQISRATGRNFIIDDKIKGKITILSEKPMTKEEAYQTFLSALEVAGFTTVTAPSGIIKIINVGDAISSPTPFNVELTPYTDSYVTRLVKLTNISALEISNVLKPLISKKGTMFAYPLTNSLIITDSGTNIARVMKIIMELDREGPQQSLEIIPINYADAKDVAAKVQQLFEIDKGAAGGVAKPSRPGAGPELEEIKGVKKIIADDRTNSIIILASKNSIDQVRAVIAKLDVPLNRGETGTIHVHYLKYAKAATIAQTLSSITSGAKQATTKPAGGATAGKDKGPLPVAQLEGGISIGADETTNALIITASAKDYQTLVDELISKLDVPSRQVYLEAMVMELRADKTKDFSIAGFGGGGNRSVLGLGNLGAANTIAGLFTGGSFFSNPGMLGGILSKDSVSVDIPKQGGGTTTVTIPAFAAFLNFLQTYNDANIVSSPNILTVDNQKASIEVTETTYATKTTTTATAGSTIAEPTPLEAGLTLEITPQITEGNAVRLELHNKLSNFTGPPNAQGAAPQAKREITTTVMAMDGQTIVLGGLMQDIVTNQKSKVPILGDIPLIGLLFRSSNMINKKSNLLVFITPHVIKDPSDFADINKMKLEQRNRFIDQNYGKKQQQLIKDTLSNHRADLLEFVPPVSSASSTNTYPKFEEKKPEYVAKKPKVKETDLAAQTTTKEPVITATPIGAGGMQRGAPATSTQATQTKETKKKPATKKAPAEQKGTEKGEVDTAY